MKQENDAIGLLPITFYRRLPLSENENSTNKGSAKGMDGQSIQSAKTEICIACHVRVSFGCVDGSPHESWRYELTRLVGVCVWSGN